MSWSRTATFHEQLAAIVAAGMPITQALQLAGEAAGGEFSAQGARWSKGLLAGRGLAEQLAADRQPAFDVALVKAGETCGRLPEHCRDLAAHYRHLVSLRRLVLRQLNYPVMLTQVGLLALGVVLTFTRDWSPAIILGLPLIFWGVVGLGALSWRVLGDSGRARLALIPPFAQITEPMVAANVCAVLRATLASGLPLPESVELAGRACGNPIVAQRIAHAGNELRHQRIAALSLALARAKLPAMVVDHARIGEKSGTLDTTLGLAASLLRETFRRRSEATARVVSGLVYAAAMLFAAGVVLFFWSSYHATLSRALPPG